MITVLYKMFRMAHIPFSINHLWRSDVLTETVRKKALSEALIMILYKSV